MSFIQSFVRVTYGLLKKQIYNVLLRNLLSFGT